jgi:hypothetical protein
MFNISKPLMTTALIAAISLAGATISNAAEGAKKPKDPKVAFEKLDTDKNGSISKEEFSAKAKDAAKADKAFDKKDTNKDGSLSLEEFSVAPAKKDNKDKKPKKDGKPAKPKKDKAAPAAE